MSQSQKSHPSRPSYWTLKAKAVLYRNLMQLGYTFDHLLGYQQSAPHSFVRHIPISAPFNTGSIPLYFYTPPSYKSSSSSSKPHPLIINFHGGGYTIGDARDDLEWANHLASTLNAVIVSVGYRKAPEYPYPYPIQDCVVAMHYLATHATELSLDVSRVVTTGFSAGGNLSLTAPMLYSALQQPDALATLTDAHRGAISKDWDSRIWFPTKDSPRCTVVGIASFYPGVEYSTTRAAKTATNPDPAASLSENIYSLFDWSYLPVRAEEEPEDPRLKDPFLSPAHASEEWLKKHLPDNVFVLTCEWDMLQAGGEAFVGRLKALRKKTGYLKVEKVTHGWDKMPRIAVRGEKGVYVEEKRREAYKEVGEWVGRVLTECS